MGAEAMTTKQMFESFSDGIVFPKDFMDFIKSQKPTISLRWGFSGVFWDLHEKYLDWPGRKYKTKHGGWELRKSKARKS